MKRVFFLIISAFVLPCAALTGFSPDFDAAVKRAKESSKPIFILFTGSDWCSWCVKLEAEVLSQKEFLDYATNAWELVVADFPQKKKVEPQFKNKYAELKKKYSVRGFPTVLLINAEGVELHKAGYFRGGAKAWLEKFIKDYELRPLIEKHIYPLREKVEGFSHGISQQMSSELAQKSDMKHRFEVMKSVAIANLPKFKELSLEVKSTIVPKEVSDKKKEIVSFLDMMQKQLEEVAALDVDKVVAEMEKELSQVSASRKNLREAREAAPVLPPAGTGNVDTSFFIEKAVPFYESHIVDKFNPTKVMDEATLKKVIATRRALVRYLATGRTEFPTGDECAIATSLWKRRCRDAAVAIVYYCSLHADDRYWKGATVLKNAIASQFQARKCPGFCSLYIPLSG